MGVKRALDRTLTLELLPQTYAFCKAFEHFFIIEIIRLHSYDPKDHQFFYLQTKDMAEIDLIIDRPGMPTALIEIKSTTHVEEKHIANLKRFTRDFQNCEAYCLSLDKLERVSEKVNILHWNRGLRELGF